MATIKIIERATGKVCASIPISVHSPDPDELFNEAWSAAVEDKAVDGARRLDYAFEVEGEE